MGNFCFLEALGGRCLPRRITRKWGNTNNGAGSPGRYRLGEGRAASGATVIPEHVRCRVLPRQLHAVPGQERESRALVG